MTEIAGYEILRKLGGGAGGTVYLAEQQSLRRQVALKVHSAGHFKDEEARNRFLNEAHILCRLSHPCVVEVYDADFAGERAYIAMQFLERGSLRHELIRLGRLPLLRVARVGAEAARGLHHAHQAGVIHRDVKPENLFLGADGDIKVGDFGLARSESSLAPVSTGAGYVVGTPGYIAPEVLAGGAVTPATDTWALGVVLFELATGSGPALNALREAQARSLLEVSLPAPSTVSPELPAEFDELVADCLAATPALRPSLPVLAKRLERLEQTLSTGRPALAAGTIGAPARPARRLRTRLGLGVGLVAGLVLFASLTLGWRTRWAPDEAYHGETAGRPAQRAEATPHPSPAEGPNRLSEAGPARPKPAPIRLITAGSDRVRLVFGAAQPVEASYRIFDLDKGGGISVKAAAGATSVLVAGLSANRPYEVRPAGEGGPGRRFRTWHKGEIPGLVKLVGQGWGASHTTIARAGDRVGVLAAHNDRPGSRVLFFESLDGGQTWSEARELAQASKLPARPWLVVARGGFLAAWYAGLEAAPRVWSAWRELDGGSWSTPRPILASAYAPALVLDAGGTGKALVSVRLAKGGVRLQLVEFGAVDGVETRRLPGPEQSFGMLGQQCLADTGNGLVWLCRVHVGPNQKRCYWSSCGPAGDKWTAVKPVEAEAGGGGHMSVLPEGRPVVLAHESPGGVRVLCQLPRGAGFIRASLLPPPAWACSTPGLGSSGNTMGLALLDGGPMTRLASSTLRLYLSEDGLNWRSAASSRVLLTSPRSLGLVLLENAAIVALQDELEGLIVVRQEFATAGSR